MDTDSFYYTISELQPSTSYYVKAYVKDVLGRLYISNDPDSVKFETPDGLPVLGEVEVLPEYDYAVLMAEIVNTGDAPVEKKGFLFGTTENLESEGDSLQVELDYNGNDLGQFEVTVSDLKPNETYYVKAYAENSFGVVETEIKYFYTKQDVPRILLYSSVKLEDGKAILTGKLEDVGRTDILEIGVYWYKEGDAEEEKKKYSLTEHLDEENEFTVILEDIIGGTPYYVYAYAENSDGTGYSDEVAFTAPARFTIQSVFPGKSGGFSASYVLGNTVYMVGGDAGSKCTDEFYFYNSLANSWGDLRSFEKEIKQITACSDGNLGYIFGGTDHEENVFDCLYSYDGRANKWIEYANLPKARYGAIGTFIYDLKSIFLIGGFNEDHQLTRTIYQYNLTTNQWSTELINFPSDIANGISFEYDGKLYIGLGTTNALWYTDNFSTDLATSWTQMEGIPAELGTVSTAVVYNEKAYMINSNGYIWEFDLETYKWNQRGTFPEAGMLDYHMFVVQNTIYILGQSFENKSQFIIYNPMWDPIVN